MTPDLKGADPLLMIGSSERCANLFYATRFRAPDPFVFLWTPSEKLMLANNLEIDRARDQACVCLLYTSPSPRDGLLSRMPSSA